MQTKDKCLAALVILCWGLNFVAIKWGLEGIPPLLLGALRFIGVVFPAILLVPRPAMPWRWLLAYGGTISLGQFAFLFCAMKFGMPAGMASLVLQSQVVFTLLFAMIWLGERWQPHHWVALPLAGLGLYLIATHIDPESVDMSTFDLPLSRADIADFLGLTIETVSRQFTKLRKENVIRIENNRHVTVPDMDRLMRYAGND